MNDDYYYYHDFESQVASTIRKVDLYHVNHPGSKSVTNSKQSKTLKPTISAFSCRKTVTLGVRLLLLEKT